MPKTIQNRFSQGELDPKMLGRSDLDQYFSAAQTMQNVISMPQGGFKRRGGLEHIDEMLRVLTFVSSPTITLSNGGTSGNINDRTYSTTSVTTNNISTTNPYVVAQYDLGSAQDIAVVHLQGLKLTVSGTSSEFYIQCSNNASTWTTMGTALTLTTTEKHYSRRVEANYRYVRLVRIGATDLSTNKVSIRDMNVYTQAANSALRLVNFEFNSDQSYMLCFTDRNIAIYRDGVFQVDVPATNITSSMLADINWAQSADTLIIFHEDINPQIVQRQGADDYWSVSDLSFDYIPYHAFTETVQTGAAAGFGTLTPAATSGTTTLTVSSGTFTAASIGQYCEGNGGVARILSLKSATVVNVYIEIPFYNTDAIPAVDWEYVTGYEPAWSVSRGWPISGTFHSGRLWIGGSKSRPTTIWGSRVGIFYDFALGSQLDDDGIEATLDTDQLNRITNIYSGRNLMVFTTGAEFIIPSSLNEPITPGNISTLRQTRVGSQRGLRVTDIEGGVFYIQNGGQSVQEFIFIDTEQAYGNNLISLLSGHLVKDPLDFCVRRATSLDDGALMAIVREGGLAAIATIQRSQGIGAFTSQTTDGEFIACGADYNDLYFGVTRNSRVYLERLNEEHYLDASVRITTGLPTDTFTGLSHLNGEECRVFADGSVLANVTPTGGSATIARDADDSCEIGLWFQPLVVDLPCAFPEMKTIIGRLLNIASITLRLYTTSSIKVNGRTLSFRGFGASGGGSPLDTAPPVYTGIKKLFGFRGWDYNGQITITQDEPGGLAVLEMSKNVLMESTRTRGSGSIVGV
jgi:hypothetical protein